MEEFFVEKPPVAIVPQEWQKASNRGIPPAMRSAVSARVKMTYSVHRDIAV